MPINQKSWLLRAALRSVLTAPLVIAVTTLNTAAAAEASSSKLEEVIIVGIREGRTSKGATGLDLTPFETPQSISFIVDETMSKMQLNDINAVLSLATGVNVEKSETDRTYYNARGFDITSMHVDGVGMPFDALVNGDIDTAIFEKVEVVRGANGLITGIGNPSGTVNYVRKRPLNELAASAKVSTGSYGLGRLELDGSIPLDSNSRWAARSVVAIQNKDSWLKHYQQQRQTLYGVVDGQISDNITLAAGYTQQSNRSKGVMWGSLPLVYSDGSQADFDISTTTTMDWTYWDVTNKTSFVELGINLSPNWQWLTTLTRSDYDEPSELFYVYLQPGLDKETGLGVQGWPGKFHASAKATQLDSNISGEFSAAGRNHQVNIGISRARQQTRSTDTAALTGFDAMPAFPGWSGNEVARPEWGDTVVAAEGDIDFNRIYGATRLALSDNLKAIVGFNQVYYTRHGFSWDVATNSDDDKLSPYYGFTWVVGEHTNVYASYSDIYQPQYEEDEEQEPLRAAIGKSYEAGIKTAWLNQRLFSSLAFFQVSQNNLAEFVGYSDCDNIPDEDTSDDFDCSEYQGIDVDSLGYEMEIYGQLKDNLWLQTSFTRVSLEDPNGDESRTFIPRRSFKLLANWEPKALEGWEFGASGRWQSRIYNNGMAQQPYALLNTYANYRVNAHLSLGLNIDNLSNEKHLNSLQFEQSYYAAPRTFTASLEIEL